MRDAHALCSLLSVSHEMPRPRASPLLLPLHAHANQAAAATRWQRSGSCGDGAVGGDSVTWIRGRDERATNAEIGGMS